MHGSLQQDEGGGGRGGGTFSCRGRIKEQVGLERKKRGIGKSECSLYSICFFKQVSLMTNSVPA